MTSKNPLTETLAAVKADLTAVTLQNRLQTMLMTIGLVAFGFMLGVHFFAAHTFGVLPPLAHNPDFRPLQSLYNSSMKYGLVVALVGLVGGFGLELAGRDTHE